MANKTVADFVGKFQSNGVINIISGNHGSWYPGKGVKLVVREEVDGGVSHGRIRIDPSGEEFAQKKEIEAAKYELKDDKLEAKMPVTAQLTVTETLEIDENRVMKHSLRFSDGASGDWICEP